VTSAATCSRMASHVVEAATELIAATNSRGGQARVLGGIGVALRCPSAQGSAPLARAYSDVDLVTTRSASTIVADTLHELGYVAQGRFNALHGRGRMLFDHPDGVHIDVFVDQFSMCHRLDLGTRLALHDTTVTLGDLLLTKLQVAELNEKDVTDAAALMLDHDLTTGEEGINVEYVTSVLCSDWGWWRTVSHNLGALPRHINGRLHPDAAAHVSARVTHLVQLIDEAPKSLRWKIRAKAGDRIPWRDEPEDRHDSPAGQR
jgi:hypothetical protein